MGFVTHKKESSGWEKEKKNQSVAAGIRAQVSTATTWNSHH